MVLTSSYGATWLLTVRGSTVMPRCPCRRRALVDGDAGAQFAEQLRRGDHVVQVRHVADRDRPVGEQRRAQDRQHRVLGAGDLHLAVQRVAAVDYDLLHGSIRDSGFGIGMARTLRAAENRQAIGSANHARLLPASASSAPARGSRRPCARPAWRRPGGGGPAAACRGRPRPPRWPRNARRRRPARRARAPGRPCSISWRMVSAFTCGPRWMRSAAAAAGSRGLGSRRSALTGFCG